MFTRFGPTVLSLQVVFIWGCSDFKKGGFILAPNSVNGTCLVCHPIVFSGPISELTY